MKKQLSLLVLAAMLGTSAEAGSHFVITPVSEKGVMAPVSSIEVSLLPGNLPAGMVGQSYAFDLTSLLSVTGDPALDLSQASWGTSNPLPPGLSLDATGKISGTPSVQDAEGGSFEVVASYKGESGRQVYAIVVDGVALHATQIVAGGYHTCAVTPAGAAKCWGYNLKGELGNGSKLQSLSPVQVAGLGAGVSSLAAGNGHTCAVLTSGAALCWGDNYYGQLGTGTTTPQLTPVQVSGMGSGVARLVAGDNHTCAVTTAGAVKCWGANSNGQLGDGTSTQRLAPVTVSGLGAGVVSLTAGNSHTCAVTSSGAAKCWGANFNGQLGDGTTGTRPTPVTVIGLSSGVTGVAAGGAYTCAVTSSGTAKCWGTNSYGQLGDGSLAQRVTPVNVAGLPAGVARVAAGTYHTCAQTAAGAALCWGRNFDGAVGDGTTTDRYTPVAVVGLSGGVAGMALSVTHTCARLASGEVNCWGLNNYGNLGDGTTVSRKVPVTVVP